MANKVLLKKSSVASKVPLTTDLDYGELALNYADGILYYKTASNTIGSISTGEGGGGVAWIKKTANYTAVSGEHIIADTSGGSFTITLPATPTTGSFVVLADGASWQTSNLIIDRNGSTIEGVAENLELDIPGIQTQLLYDGATWEVYALAGPSVSVSNDTTSDLTQYPTMARSTTGVLSNTYLSTTKFSFNPATGTLNTTNYNSLSDATLKDNIQTLVDPIKVVNQIRPVSFKWKDTGATSFGVIAQEIEGILPELVGEADGKKNVNYTQLIAFLIGSVQQLSTKVDALEGIINGKAK